MRLYLRDRDCFVVVVVAVTAFTVVLYMWVCVYTYRGYYVRGQPFLLRSVVVFFLSVYARVRLYAINVVVFNDIHTTATAADLMSSNKRVSSAGAYFRR